MCYEEKLTKHLENGFFVPLSPLISLCSLSQVLHGALSYSHPHSQVQKHHQHQWEQEEDK